MILDKTISTSSSTVPFSLKERMMKNRITSTEDFYSYLNKMKKILLRNCGGRMKTIMYSMQKH